MVIWPWLTRHLKRWQRPRSREEHRSKEMAETYIGWLCSNVIQAGAELSVLLFLIYISALLKRKWMQFPTMALSIKYHLYVLYQRYTISTSRHRFQSAVILLPLTDCISSGLCSCFMVNRQDNAIQRSSFSLNTHLAGSVFGIAFCPVRPFDLSLGSVLGKYCVRDKARQVMKLSCWHNILGKMEVGCTAG